MSRLEAVLQSWAGTPYMHGQQCKGAGVDCVRFVFAVLDELLGVTTPVVTLPPDVCVHAPEKAEEHVERLRACYDCAEVPLDAIEPGDVVVSGPVKGGPGHVFIMGEGRVLWHATHPRVHKTPVRGVILYGHSLRRAFRVKGLVL